ncbi:hypothetical protein HBZ99_004543 [Salmonella enterica subsp. enterica]|nr:hypothetical protein [Salmonella enterica subsp. enterica serovar Oranienburg]EEP8814129.1 hypothetical protein [Salmonella enterica subsp. enterica serovar Oranienburg]EHI3196357.1 hypothetical protein [Salmonella enterica]EIG0952019.1 hypothetical protein [Salmonella enterica subsp. enterica serovar Muenchen]
MKNIEQLRKVSARAHKMLVSLSDHIHQQKDELHLNEFYQVYSKAALYRLPKLVVLSDAAADQSAGADRWLPMWQACVAFR